MTAPPWKLGDLDKRSDTLTAVKCNNLILIGHAVDHGAGHNMQVNAREWRRFVRQVDALWGSRCPHEVEISGGTTGCVKPAGHAGAHRVYTVSR